MASTANPLHYTKNASRLSPIQMLFYEKNGYIVFPRLVPKEILDKCHQRFDDIITEKVPRDSVLTVMRDVKDRKLVNKIQDFNRDEVLREYIEYKGILDIAESFTGPNIMAMHTMMIAKPPDSGFGTSKHPPHQDLYYFPFRPADRIVAAWTAIEPCDKENGCLSVAPGSHIPGKLYTHDYPPGAEPGTVNKFYHGILDLPDITNWVDLEMQPGDTVFFHPLLVHESGVNTSNRTRMAISCHYAAADCQYIDVEGTVQKRIKDEIMQRVEQIMPGGKLEFTDVWRFKSTLVRGLRSSL